MAAILGLDDVAAEAACVDGAQGEVVEAVNYNAPGQIVIAGQIHAVERAIAAAKARGAKRAVLLPVSVPAHSSLLKGAAAQFKERLDDTNIATPKLRYLSAVDATEHATPDSIRAILGRQLASPVRWTSTVQALIAQGATAAGRMRSGQGAHLPQPAHRARLGSQLRGHRRCGFIAGRARRRAALGDFAHAS